MTTTVPTRPHDGRVSSPGPAPRPTRRRFTGGYKAAIVAEYDGCTSAGEKGALLRREDRYSSHITEWRRASATGSLAGLTGTPRSTKRTPDQVELEKLRRRNERLERELAKTEAALMIMGKLTSSWSCSPRARAEPEPPTSLCPAGPAPGQPLSVLSAGEGRPAAAAGLTTERPHPRRTQAGPGGAAHPGACAEGSACNACRPGASSSKLNVRSSASGAQVSGGVPDRVADVDHAVVESSVLQQFEVESYAPR